MIFSKNKQVPYIRQLEMTDCGPTCIQMIAAYYGKRYSVRTIKQFCDVTKLGISMHDLINACRKIGFETASITIGIKEAEANFQLFSFVNRKV